MKAEADENKLARAKSWLMFFGGATLVFLAWAITGPSSRFSYGWGFYILWFVFQIVAASGGFVMLVSRSWREMPLLERMDTAFGFLALAWFLFLAFLVKSNRDEGYLYGGMPTLLLYALFAGAGMVLVLSYWMLRRNRAASLEEMFP